MEEVVSDANIKLHKHTNEEQVSKKKKNEETNKHTHNLYLVLRYQS